MKYHLPERIVRELCSFAQKYSITRIVLFGSRARGTNAERSDIDIAVYGGDFDNFYWDVADSGFSIKCEMSPSVLYFMCGKLSHLPHRSHMTRSDGGRSYLHKPQFHEM